MREKKNLVSKYPSEEGRECTEQRRRLSNPKIR